VHCCFSDKLVANFTKEIVPKNYTRIAHLTDIHIFDNERAIEGMGKAIDYLKKMEIQPDFVFTGGDSIMDSLGKTKEKTAAQWKIWHNAVDNIGIPMIACIGNHDVWGWSLPFVKSKPANDYSKKWASDELKIPNRYYTRDIGKWKVIVLDSTYPVVGLGYQAKIDNEQFEWLKEELKSTPNDKFVCVLSHIPILSITPFFDGKTERSNGGYKISRANQHSDGRKLKNLFYQYPNVKCALSGHIHQVDEVNFLGVKYCCNGAVCGAWWNGKYHEFGPALAIVDLYDNGQIENKVVYLNI
jgi:Icc protein